VDILVATPLRLKSLIEKNKVSLRAVRYLVLDEADKLFEMGFVDQVDAAVGRARTRSARARSSPRRSPRPSSAWLGR